MNKNVAPLIAGLLILVLLSCSLGGADAHDDDSGVTEDVPILESPEEISDFIEEFDEPVHDFFYEYAVRFNRVNSLVNGALFADPSKTDLRTLQSLSDSALTEVDDFISFCREMESWSKETLGPAIEDAKALLDDKTFSKSRVEGLSDTAYARRLVEMMLDPDYEASFSPEDISKHTGVEMTKIRFLMQQVSNAMGDAVDNLEVDFATKNVEFYETVRDTAGAVNSTLALATPFGAFGTAGAATLGSFGTGCLAKAKYAYTVFENTSAAVTFAGNMVNIAVPEENISTTVKTVTEYNGYIGLLFGGAGGFTGSNRTEKALAIIGTTSDGYTTYFNVDDDGITSSTTPQLDTTTPVDLETNIYGGILPNGDYLVPAGDWEDWELPDFDWDLNGEDYWEEIYEGLEDITGSAYDEIEAAYAQFALDWRETHGPNPTEPAVVDRPDDEDLPAFFDLPDEDDEYADHEGFVITPDPDSFEVGIHSTGSVGFLPFDLTFTAQPNSSFLRERLKLSWDFGDGSTKTQIVGDEDFIPEVEHSYSEAGTYTVSLEAEDIRGYTAESEIEITAGSSLQEVIDSYKGKEAIIHVPGGTYTGWYLSGHVLKVWEGITLWGSKDSSIIEATIEMYPDSAIEGFTLRGGKYGIIKNASDINLSTWREGDTYDVDIIGNTFDAPDYQTAIWMTGLTPEGGEEIFYSGEISGNTCTTGLSHFLLIGKYTGIISSNTVKDTDGIGMEVSLVRDSTVSGNSFENSEGMKIYSSENSKISDNVFKNTKNTALAIYSLSGNSSCTANTITGGTNYSKGLYIGTLADGSSVTDHTVTGMSDTAFTVSTLAGEVSGNEIQDNTAITSLWVYTLEETGVLNDNKVMSNSGGAGIFETGGTITNNTISGNAGTGMSVTYFRGGSISGNTITSNQNGGAYIPSTRDTDDPQPSPKIKDANTISGNTGPGESNTDLWSIYADDRIPEDPEGE